MVEIWKDVVGYEGLYHVSDLGNVKSLHRGKQIILSQKHHHSGYLTVGLTKNGFRKDKGVHNLVADAFIENPLGKPCVNHIDGNKHNNIVSNLEWVTHSENTRHAIMMGLRLDSNMRGRIGILNPLSKQVNQFTKDGQFIKTWDCISDVARYYNCKPCTVVNCCAGRKKSAKGFIWKYLEA